MNNQQRHSVFTLLYAMVLIDNRVIKVEVDQYFKTLEDFLIEVAFLTTLQAKAMISNWFVQNYRDILAAMKSQERLDFLLNHAENLKSYEHRQKVFDMLKDIAVADNEFHTTEQQILNVFSEVWGLDG